MQKNHLETFYSRSLRYCILQGQYICFSYVEYKCFNNYHYCKKLKPKYFVLVVRSHFNYFLFGMSLSSQFLENFFLKTGIYWWRYIPPPCRWHHYPAFQLEKEHKGECTRQLQQEIYKSEEFLQVLYSIFGIFIYVID